MHLVAGVNPVACGRPAEIADGRFGAIPLKKSVLKYCGGGDRRSRPCS